MGVTRETLYAEVWAEPMITVAKRYGVSSSFLARVCKRLQVPRPPRGYWQQLAVGKTVERPTLEAPGPGAELEWSRVSPYPPRRTTAPTSVTLRPPRARREGQEKHPLLVGARAHFDHARESRRETHVRPYKQVLVDILVSKEALSRALELASDFFLLLETRGQRVMLATGAANYRRRAPEVREGLKGDRNAYGYDVSRMWAPARPTLSWVGDVAFGLTLFEVSEYAEARYDSAVHRFVRLNPPTPQTARAKRALGVDDWTRKKWIPSGRLAIHAYAPYSGVYWERTWCESKPSDLESQFIAIGKELEAEAPQIVKLVQAEARRVEEQERRWRAEKEEHERQVAEERRRLEEQRRREAEARRDAQFAEMIGRWRLARDVREYIAETRGVVEAGGRAIITPDGELDQHLKWAAAYAERVDPLTGLRREVAEMVAKHGAECGCNKHEPERAFVPKSKKGARGE